MLFFTIDRDKKESLYSQVYRQLRDDILSQKLKGGEKLTSTRTLAREYHMARNIFIDVYEQLKAEGYLESQHGSGTYVARGIPYYPLHKMNQNPVKNKRYQSPPVLSDMSSGIPDLQEFPENQWIRSVKEALITLHSHDLGYHSNGDSWLISAIKKYLLKIKRIECRDDQIIICAGSFQALHLASLIFKDLKKSVVLEDPVYSPIYRLFRYYNFKLWPVPLDGQGLLVDRIPRDVHPSFYYVTPSHHYPTGAVLTVQRRIQLIELARKNQAYILENDYGSEFRYVGLPLSALHFLEPQRVAYVGTLSMSLFPAIRLGYLIVPPHLVDKAREARVQMGFDVPVLTQRSVAHFMESGYFRRHLMKMRRHYLKKQEALIKTLKYHFGDRIEFRDRTAGLYLTCRIHGLLLNSRKRKKIQAAGILLNYAGDHQIKTTEYNDELILGFGNLALEDLEPGVRKLKEILMD